MLYLDNAELKGINIMCKNEKVKNIGDNMLTIVLGVLLFGSLFFFYIPTKEKEYISDYQFSEQKAERVSVQKSTLLVKAKK